MEQTTKTTYSVSPVKNGLLQINGFGDHPLWDQAVNLIDFIYPWNEGHPPVMSFQALHDRDWLYGIYRVKDKDNIIVCTKDNSKASVLKSDRVEIFFRKDAHMNPYYGLEMDALGRVYDFEARFYRKFHSTWDWPASHLKVKSTLMDAGYTLEFAVSKQSLNDLGLIYQDSLEAGLYRGKCIASNCDKEEPAEFKWISWINPESLSPDFHIPSSFGKLILSH